MASYKIPPNPKKRVFYGNLLIALAVLYTVLQAILAYMSYANGEGGLFHSFILMVIGLGIFALGIAVRNKALADLSTQDRSESVIDAPRYKLAEKRVRYGVIVWMLAAFYVAFIVALRFANPAKYGFEWIHAFLPVVLVIVGWTMRLSGRHEMREELAAK